MRQHAPTITNSFATSAGLASSSWQHSDGNCGSSQPGPQQGAAAAACHPPACTSTASAGFSNPGKTNQAAAAALRQRFAAHGCCGTSHGSDAQTPGTHDQPVGVALTAPDPHPGAAALPTSFMHGRYSQVRPCCLVLRPFVHGLSQLRCRQRPQPPYTWVDGFD